MKHPQLLLISLVSILLSLPTPARETTNATGFVYDDRNRNGKRDPGEPGLPNVLVSNQREVVRTDLMGRWTLPVRDDCIFFVIKPRGWMPPVSEQQLDERRLGSSISCCWFFLGRACSKSLSSEA